MRKRNPDDLLGGPGDYRCDFCKSPTRGLWHAKHEPGGYWIACSEVCANEMDKARQKRLERGRLYGDWGLCDSGRKKLYGDWRLYDQKDS